MAGNTHADDLLHEVLVVPRRAFVPMPDTQVFEHDGLFQIVTPSLPDGGLNEVAFCRADDDDVEAVIDEALRRYDGIRFRWTVGPDSRPLDLGARLARRGLRPSVVVGVARGTEPLPQPVAPAWRITAVSADDVDDFTEVMAKGWGVSPRPIDALNRNALRQAPHALPMFVARIEGKPVAAAAYYAFERSAYLLGGIVLPEYRGRGLYRGLVAARLEHARNRGLTLATSVALETTAYPLLVHLGFEAVCRMQVFTRS